MQSRTRLNLMLLVATAILVLVAVLEPGKRKVPVAPALTERRAAQVRDVLIPRRNGKSIRLARRRDGWWMETPYRVRARAQRAKALAGLVEARSEASYPAAQLKLADLQLDPPRAELQLDGKRFLFGGTDPIRYRRYVRLGDRVHLTADLQYHHLVASATDFVDTALLGPHAEPIAIRLPNLALELVDGRWRLSPPQPDASADAFQALVDEWRYARAEAVEPYAAGASLGTIEIRLKADGPPLRLGIARRAPALVLARPELGLAYRFPPATAQGMLSLTPPGSEPQETHTQAPGAGTENEPETLPADPDAAATGGEDAAPRRVVPR